MPFARATGIGSTFDCADHSKSVCFFERAIPSSPVMDLFNVSAVIPSSFATKTRKHEKRFGRLHFVLSWFRGCSSFQHRVALRLELVPRFPIREPVGLRDTVADREQHLQIF